MRVLLTVASFSPNYGGPAVSVGELAGSLARLDAAVGVWASDASQSSSPLLPDHPNLMRLTGALADVFSDFRPSISHDNGIWLCHNHRIAALAQRSGVPRIVSLRGMLDPWARRHKKLKKTFAWSAYQKSDLMRAQCHHATAVREAQHIDSYGLGVPVAVIPNGVSLPDTEPRASSWQDREGSVALFFGRLHPVKGLPALIEAWARSRPRGWRLRIVGPDENGYLAHLQELVAENNLDGLVEFSSAVAPGYKSQVYASADIVILPSASENFGMVVAEALAHGVPVLTTTGTPWTMLDQRGCGWCVAPTREGIEAGLRRATSLAPNELARMGNAGRDWVRRQLSWDSIGERFLQLYETMLAGRPVELNGRGGAAAPAGMI